MLEIKKKFQLYKRLFQFTLIMNGFFIALGIIGLIRFLETNDVKALHIMIVGICVLFFGILIPWAIFNKLLKLNRTIRQQTEEAVAKWVGGLIETYKDSEGKNLTDPMFWLNVLLMTIEVFGENVENPNVAMLVETIPLIRQELKKSRSKKKSKSSD